MKDVLKDKRRSQKHPPESKAKATPENSRSRRSESAGSEGASECGESPQREAAEGARTELEEEEQIEAETTPAGEALPSTASESAEQLQAALENVNREKEQLQDQLLRLRADFDNYRKRVVKEKNDIIQYGNESLLRDLLPLIDNMERVLSYSLKEQNWKSLQDGIELVLAEMRKTLAQGGLEAVQAVGNPFDPNLHEAIQQVETSEASPDTVLEECQRGYLYRGRLLRPSRVVVAVPCQRPVDEAHGSGAQGGDDEPSMQDKPLIN